MKKHYVYSTIMDTLEDITPIKPYSYGSHIMFITDEARNAYHYISFGRKCPEDAKEACEIMSDLISIWQHILPIEWLMNNAGMTFDSYFFYNEKDYQILPSVGMIIDQINDARFHDALLNEAEKIGLPSYIDAYFEGVPVEDIVA